MAGGWNARARRAVGQFIQLCELRGAGSRRSSAAAGAGDCGRSTGGAFGGFRAPVLEAGTAIDRTGETAARAAVAGVLLGPLGAPADRAARLQPVIPLV